ncbi:unnamed protein product [Acanthoscelides obtectus]|uniref:HAT C-terminal dimerisation domain-containing protein n=1 Tax=Acanthoscelides obtectus TaxID=200917 RepID=A0A9P0KIQ4_ACAOB|nr:unnamed protein product [Acanthoscelides obtectus]CAK1630705.1 hypothetical protein AOBTE_LOCUS6508 [Acanthoscelides obtectus]
MGVGDSLAFYLLLNYQTNGSSSKDFEDGAVMFWMRQFLCSSMLRMANNLHGHHGHHGVSSRCHGPPRYQQRQIKSIFKTIKNRRPIFDEYSNLMPPSYLLSKETAVFNKSDNAFCNMNLENIKSVLSHQSNKVTPILADRKVDSQRTEPLLEKNASDEVRSVLENIIEYCGLGGANRQRDFISKYVTVVSKPRTRIRKKNKHHPAEGPEENYSTFLELSNDNKNSRRHSSFAYSLAKNVNNKVQISKYTAPRFCGAFELALRGHDEKENSENRGIFKELVNFSTELDNELKVHIQCAKLFKGTSKTTQNELLECMLDVYHEEVKKEIANSPFVAVIADETTDVACEFQYLCKGQPVERFWRFYVPDGHDAKSIAACVLNVVNPLLDQNPNKLIAQSYDDKNRLKTELQVLYQREELSTTSGAVPLSILLNEEGLNCTFQETLKLLSILITIPMSTSEAERSFSMLKRIKTFLRNTMKEERLSALGMLSAEKHFVSGIENFNNKQRQGIPGIENDKNHY